MATADATKSLSSSQEPKKAPQLEILDRSKAHVFALPVKRIQDGQHVTDFLSSRAYQQVMTFLFQLNEAMYPRAIEAADDDEGRVQTWELGSSKVDSSEPVLQVAKLLQKLEHMIDDFPPDPGPRRFGNVSFRRWSEAVESRLSGLVEEYLPSDVLTFPADTAVGVSAKEELSSYFLGSFGSSQRLDYGTGHELSFLAFLGCLWMLGGFPRREPGVEERAIVLGVIEPYLHLVRRLIQTYTLEPAGSHGVWGLDDHSFLPYIFGSAQLCPPVSPLGQLPAEGSYLGAANPADVAKASVVAEERERNMYFAAIGFIYDVKRGPFWEHSPILYDISGVKAGWAKINKGMIKMYNAEVLSKFPVVQHFPFGSLFSWERDLKAPPPPESQTQSLHTARQPSKNSSLPSDTTAVSSGPSPSPRVTPSSSSQVAGTKAPWASTGTGTASPPTEIGATAAPWAGASSATISAPAGNGAGPVTRAPWAVAASNRPRAPPPASWGPKQPATKEEPKK